MRSAQDILNEARRLPKFQENFERLLANSEQAIIFGSYAAGVQRRESDIDILFVTNEKNVKTSSLDFVCLKPSRLFLKTWLGTELANHIAKYGIWIKGDDDWRHKVFIGKTTLDRKKIIILNRLAHLYIKHQRLSQQAMLQLFKDVIFDCLRLIHMAEGNAIPANVLLTELFKREHRNIMEEVVKEEYLGKVGEVYFNYLFYAAGYEIIEQNLKDLLI